MNNIKKCIDWKDILLRAVKTFIQAFIAVLSVDGVITVQDFNGLKTAALSATIATISALLSAFMNVCTCLIKLNESKNNKDLPNSNNENE